MKQKLTPITITVDGEEVSLFKRRLKYRERTRLAGILREGLRAIPKLDDDGNQVVGDDGKAVFEDISIPVANVGNYRLELIRVSLCNEAGRPFFTEDEIDEWDTPDIDRAVEQIESENNLADSAVETVRGNSETTADADSSSASV